MKLKSLIAAALFAAVLSGTGCTSTVGRPCNTETPWECSDSAMAKLPQGELAPAYRAQVKAFLAGQAQ